MEYIFAVSPSGLHKNIRSFSFPLPARDTFRYWIHRPFDILAGVPQQIIQTPLLDVTSSCNIIIFVSQWLYVEVKRVSCWLGVVACVCNLATGGPGGGNCRCWGFRPSSAHVDRASVLSSASIWRPCRRVRSPGCLRRGAPGQGGNPAAKSPHVVQ